MHPCRLVSSQCWFMQNSDLENPLCPHPIRLLSFLRLHFSFLPKPRCRWKGGFACQQLEGGLLPQLNSLLVGIPHRLRILMVRSYVVSLVLKQCGSSFTHSEVLEWEAPDECWDHVTLFWRVFPLQDGP